MLELCYLLLNFPLDCKRCKPSLKPMAHPQTRVGAIAQLDGTQRHGESPKPPSSPTVEQLLRGETTRWSPHTSPTFGRDHDMEDDHVPHQKKSVLTKVKEKAKKWRNTLSKKKNNEDGNATPSWGVSLEDDEDEDAEYLGAPMYESEMAPEGYKETARQHPRADPVIPENHVLTNNVNCSTEQYSANAENSTTKSMNEKQDDTLQPSKTIRETVSEKLVPAYATVAGATHAIASKIQSLTILTPQTPNPLKLNSAARSPPTEAQAAPGSALAALGRAAPASEAAAMAGGHSISREQIWDKGVSVKEYIMHKLEPGEDERALSQVISEAISPRKTPVDAGVVEKVRVAVTSLLRNEEPSQHTVYHSAQDSSSHIPISTNAREVVEEENHGRVLQSN